MQPLPEAFRQVQIDPDDLVVVGNIGAAHGIKGWFRVISHTQPRAGISRYQPWYVKHEADAQWLEIKPLTVREQGKYLVAQAEGCNDRNLAEALRGAQIAIPRSEFETLPEDDYYWHQLQGLTVLTQSQLNLGLVDHLIETGSNDVLVVNPTDQSIDGQQRLIPYLWDRVVKKVDLELQQIQVDWEPDY